MPLPGTERNKLDGLTDFERGLINQSRSPRSVGDSLSASGGGVELGPFGKKFVGLGLILLGLWTAPEAGAAGVAWIIPGGLLGLGVLGLIKGIRESWGESWYPFEDARGRSGTVLRFLWAMRPRLWLFTWIIIVGVFMSWGSPHLLWEYEKDGGNCTYLGLNGVENTRVYKDCPIVKAFPMR